MKEKKRCTAVVLAAGQGTRMGTSVQKQYLKLEGRPLVYYALKTFEESSVIDDVALVVGGGQVTYVREQIVRAYGFTKVSAVVEGGRERYDSVYEGLKAAVCADDGKVKDGYVFVHDGARPFADEEMLRRQYEAVVRYRACVAGMPSKDTVKLVDDDNYAVKTPERKYVWTVQTPQVFENSLIMDAYSMMMGEDCEGITDDAMAVERYMHVPVKLVEGSYRNIKITTPEDMEVAHAFLNGKN
ncbi:2-C-methyl-D-erythritol 4-phosphate cytidylyltransferase [[Clostridium] hylemonae]|uniref:2-C-methyl-D-erythritol 4-phosphate cytidylyltransferase n=1 Tax=[Clostridium] hylemonae TaxID=89153 RepID=UPI0011071932|nr:2-C-methyl-D-erythritol 4-phosphate cytidylyltransferase [[Clostridium] hylemonae]